VTTETPKPGEVWWVKHGELEMRVRVVAVEGERVFYEYVQTGMAGLNAFVPPRARRGKFEATP
jgi:hypothetical protein